MFFTVSSLFKYFYFISKFLHLFFMYSIFDVFAFLLLSLFVLNFLFFHSQLVSFSFYFLLFTIAIFLEKNNRFHCYLSFCYSLFPSLSITCFFGDRLSITLSYFLSSKSHFFFAAPCCREKKACLWGIKEDAADKGAKAIWLA